MIMNKKIPVLICLWLSAINFGFSQNSERTIYTLNDCIEIAISNNLDLKNTTLKTKTAAINYNQVRLDMIPSLNANYNIGINNGRSIDPFSNDYVNQELTFSNAALSLNATLFNGFRMLNTIKQYRFSLAASEMEVEEAKQHLILDVTLRYIQILNAKELVALAKSRVETTKTQLKRLETHYKLGDGNPIDYTDMKGQYALDQMSVINSENNFKTALLALFKLLAIEIAPEVSFENILGLVTTDKYAYSADMVYDDALKNLATFKSKQLRIDALDAGIKVARARYSPEISLFGQLNTNYSSVAKSFTNTGTIITETGDFVDINSQEVPVLRNVTQFEGTKIDYNEQFNNNLNSVVGVSVRVPLFNGFKSKNSVSLQKIQQEESLIDLQNTKLIFKQSIEEAYNNMEVAFDSYYILLDQVNSFDESFRVNEIRFNNGVSNIVDYITSKNNMDSAKLNLSKTKYEYLLRVKILEYYRGL